MPLDKMIVWCLKQKAGIKLEKPNDDLCKSYLKEANDALVSMNANINVGLRKWVVITAYYARYNAIYALLSKIGVKSEIHDCSIALMCYLFSDIFDKKFFNELEEAKQQRVNVQYYTERTIIDSDYNKNISSVADFVLNVEKAISQLSSRKISEAREKLERLIRNE
jgi:uncharacterized protein (UPF0332 family)